MIPGYLFFWTTHDKLHEIIIIYIRHNEYSKIRSCCHAVIMAAAFYFAVLHGVFQEKGV